MKNKKISLPPRGKEENPSVITREQGTIINIEIQKIILNNGIGSIEETKKESEKKRPRL